MHYAKEVYQGTTAVLNERGIPVSVMEVAELIERDAELIEKRIPRLTALPTQDLVVLFSHFVERELALEAERETYG